MTASIIYEGNLRCVATHVQSGTVIETDAPTDNRGKGEKFSPTDLLCVSLGTCMITTIAIKSGDRNIDIKDTTVQVTKHMLSDPRRVGQVDVNVKFLTSLFVNENDKMFLEATGNNCPVAKSIHPDIKVNIVYEWNLTLTPLQMPGV
ncbi:MAG: OsmC family protein [Ginsengibacter sp.]